MFVSNGFSDWEPSVLIAGLNTYTDFTLKTLAVDRKPVRSMGNLLVIPHTAIDDADVLTADFLLLPGGTTWEKENDRMDTLVKAMVGNKKTVAAIGSATVFLGQHGYLNEVMHTSNHITYLKRMAPAYQGEDWYVNRPCVSDKNLITAGGNAIVEFAGAVFDHFKLFDNNEILTSWFRLFQIKTAA